MSMGSDTTWVGKKPIRRIGGMSDALSIAADLGFVVASPPSQEQLEKLSTTSGEKGDELVRVLRELTAVQRKIADLQVELQGRKDDKNVAHLTHVSEMEKKIDTLSRITTILKDVIHNKIDLAKNVSEPGGFLVTYLRHPCCRVVLFPVLWLDRIIARLQQPYSLDCIPVEAEYQVTSMHLSDGCIAYQPEKHKLEVLCFLCIHLTLLLYLDLMNCEFLYWSLTKQFSELLMKAAGDFGALTASAADFQWSQNFKESPSVWGEMLRPIPVALASCTRFFEAMSAMRESFATLQNLRGGHLGKDSSERVFGGSDCVTPPWRNDSSFDDLAIRTVRRQELERQEAFDGGGVHQADDTSHRRLSWPPSVKHNGI
ncbi:hypothetical protein POTOM_048629 [Populus tomentosa]|uniref:Uncharacterized protein n=1 Tax=Populus tomentosa TaxID=118781 RepID=A0A8X7YGW0_POPTO|nr:hypothetical protein POTOM_048629 [Populus tomentosa]